MVAWYKSLARRARFNKRYDIINYFARRNGYSRYLEIGIARGKCIERIECAQRVGVDPQPRCEPRGWTLHETTSDEFFAGNREQFDVVLIDGLHHAEQVFRDFFNTLKVLSPGGLILLHDCNPQTETAQQREPKLDEFGNWNGDTWKAMVFLRQLCPDLFAPVMDFDQGVGVVFPAGTAFPAFDAGLEQRAADAFAALDWAGLVENRHRWLDILPDKAALLASMERAGVQPQPA